MEGITRPYPVKGRCQQLRQLERNSLSGCGREGGSLQSEGYHTNIV